MTADKAATLYLMVMDQHVYRYVLKSKDLLPGFEWLRWPGFIAGAVGSLLYGWYIAVLIVPLYRFFGRGERT